MGTADNPLARVLSHLSQEHRVVYGREQAQLPLERAKVDDGTVLEESRLR